MHALGIPTTRAASLITSDTRIERDPLYNGAVRLERASVVGRVAPSFLRLVRGGWGPFGGGGFARMSVMYVPVHIPPMQCPPQPANNISYIIPTNLET
jgi:hypothetical protein